MWYPKVNGNDIVIPQSCHHRHGKGEGKGKEGDAIVSGTISQAPNAGILAIFFIFSKPIQHEIAMGQIILGVGIAFSRGTN